MSLDNDPIGTEMRMLYLLPEEDWLRDVANERALYALCKAGAGWETIEVLPRDPNGAQEVRAIKTRGPRTIDDMAGAYGLVMGPENGRKAKNATPSE